MKGGFALLNDKVSLALVDKSALFNFGEMARICLWINKQGALVLDFVFDLGLKNAQCVRNGRKGGTAAQILAREGALASGAPRDAYGQPSNKAAVDWLLMGAEEGMLNMTWEQIEEGAAKGGRKGGKTAQILARAGALVSGALRDASGQPTNKAAVDSFLMGAQQGTCDMTWEQIEEGADKLRAKGGETSQIVMRAGALVSGAPRDASGQPTNKAAMDWLLMGADQGTRDMTWEQIEEGSDKLRDEGGAICKTAASRKRKREGGFRTGKARKAACLVMAQDDSHSHACILPECGLFCTPECRPSKKSSTKTTNLLPPLVPGRPKTDIQFQKAYVSQMSQHGRTVHGGGVYLYRLLKTAEILQASSRSGRCDEHFRDGSVCAANRRLFFSCPPFSQSDFTRCKS